MSLAVAATVFVLLFPAELPDNTALASLILGSRYRPGFVFAGVAAAFALHVALAVAVGSLLTLLPHRAVEVVVAVLFLAGALLLLGGRRGHGDDYIGVSGSRTRFWRVAATSFTRILVAEFGDITQILTASLAARYHDPVAVGIGSVLAPWSVAAMAIALAGLAQGHPAHVDHPGRRGGDADPRQGQPRRGDLVNQPAGARV